MAIVKINPISDEGWLNFINQSSEATVFHHPAWLSVLKYQYKFPVFAVCVEDENGQIRAGIPFCEVKDLKRQKRLISLPFTDHCEILYQDVHDTEKILEYLIANYGSLGERNIEIRSRIPVKNDFKEFSDVLSHRIGLDDDPEKVFLRFRSSHIRSIKKALRNGLRAEIASSSYALDEFYRLHLLTRKKLGIPIQPKSYFNNLYEQIIDKKFGFILLVLKEDRTIAASIFLNYSNTLIYKYGASDPRFLYLRPNNLLFWEAIKEACLRRVKYLDLGKTDIKQTGLRRFKSGWGAEEFPLYYSFYPHVPNEQLFNSIKEKIVSPLIRHTPKILCRITGELFYKYYP